MIRSEYLRFMQGLTGTAIPGDVRKMANIVLTNIDALEPLGTAAGQRIKKIVALAKQEFDTASADIAAPVPENQEQLHLAACLKSLTVGPFRGFSKSEKFDLSSRIVLIYGPNGTGKSSFCEALEYGLLASVEEAQSKRFRQTSDYLKNAYVDVFSPPIIEAQDSAGNPLTVKANESKYRFCFVEKNRIDNFSRIAAHLPARQLELISTLFGLDLFNEFVGGFSSEIDPKYIDVIGEKNTLLVKKQQALAGYKATIETNRSALLVVTEEENTLAATYKPDTTYADLILALGTEETPGEIQTLENELRAPFPTLSGFTKSVLDEVKTSLAQVHADLSLKEDELATASEGLSFKQLYQAVTDLKDKSPEKCPACKTPLTKAACNPFEEATEQLAKLQYLSVIEQERDTFHTTLKEHLRTLHAVLKKICEHAGKDIHPIPLQDYERATDSELNWDWWQLFHTANVETTAWEQLSAYVDRFEQQDAKTLILKDERDKEMEHLKKLRDIDKKIAKLQTKRQALEESSKAAQTAVDQFNITNDVLINEAAAEKAVVTKNQELVSTYSNFVTMLTAYADSLPGKLVADLGELVAKLYNAFNRTDSPNNLLSTIRLPLASGERIKISFQNKPELFFDALHVLSEGHIRCIGLAILLAKNLTENCPILIFDDPVNAIDDEHRSSIRKTLFEDSYFSGKQIILACHGEEFFKDIHQLIGAKQSRESCSYIFQAQDDEKHVVFISQRQPKNYVAAANELFSTGEIRDALMMSRRALESLSTKVWWHFVKSGGGQISISKRNPDTAWDLRSLTEKLCSEYRKADFEIPNKVIIVKSLGSVLGEGGADTRWLYLNKGTHEEADRGEFDRETVRVVITALTNLDAALIS
ncbi:MAG: AAA family ATPase [Pseudomonadota bacterium]